MQNKSNSADKHEGEMKQRFVVRSEEEANCYQLASVLEAEACLGGTESLPQFHKKRCKKKKRWRSCVEKIHSL